MCIMRAGYPQTTRSDLNSDLDRQVQIFGGLESDGGTDLLKVVAEVTVVHKIITARAMCCRPFRKDTGGPGSTRLCLSSAQWLQNACREVAPEPRRWPRRTPC
jgi:hypothetical protein